jgi:plastocyanin
MVKRVLRGIQSSIDIRIGRRLTPAVVLATALLISACGSSSHHSSALSMPMSMSMSHAAVPQVMPTSAIVTSGHAAVQITNYAFIPARITVKAGTRITWTNHDKTAHTATANNHSFGTGTIAPKASKTVDFKRPGVYKYHCVFHAFMTATVVVKP